MTVLSETARQLRNEYIRRWRQKNPDKKKQYEINYWERQANSLPIEQRAKDLYRNGMTQREIAKQLNVSVGTINKYLNQE